MMTNSTASDRVIVWDRFIRFFHWSLVLGFSSAYLTAEFNEIDLHKLVGYFLVLLVLSRVIWGFIGSPYARFSSFLFSFRTSLDYIHSLHTGTPIHYLGHNPLGAVMVFSLLSTLGAVFFTGMITLASIEFEGPFVPFIKNLSDAQVYLIQDIHEVLTNVMLGLIFFHIVGAVSASIQHKENLILAMFNGRKHKYFNSSIKIKGKYNEK